MQIRKEEKESRAIKIIAEEDGVMVGHAYLYLIYNNLHTEPYGLLEDICVEEKFRNAGIGTKLLQMIIEEAKLNKCYKLIGTSRMARQTVHDWYKRLGFVEHGLEFRMDFK
ncbi:MAG: GCN5-related N-acetyltransferase [Candidatus Magasanikbacteria bacterium GW2011_GWC2_34_16]|uniref:GCN5-related N-acetyltransferase n=2 Tax=Candidatus Magasanikiibacteriota TaxID=1752731 RepID=A0A0G0JU60_9BACT|nr:MAG: GCN5-related N-acetyltransferase [Candidatus Magasanikbacteria bacterium GW2011_GWC2_34_16]KKQ40494.1 MAG: GCN5-related N-acetyltransferase [Candidatus Magasanikbacteria bacterium GW2011_GWA2_37_8]